MKWKKKLKLHAGLAYQTTNRSSEFVFEEVNLTSLTLNTSFEWEVIDQLYLLGNFFILQSSGTDQLPIRNSNDVIINYSSFNVDGMESNLAGGLKFNFSEKVYLALMYESSKNNFVVDNPYQFNQTSIYYIIKF